MQVSQGVKPRPAGSGGVLLAGNSLMFARGFIWIVAGIGVKHCRIERLIVTGRSHETLGLHISVEVASESKGRHHTFDEAVSVVGFFFQIALFVNGVPPGISLLDGEMRINIEVDAHGLILRIDQRNALRSEAAS